MKKFTMVTPKQAGTKYGQQAIPTAPGMRVVGYAMIPLPSFDSMELNEGRAKGKSDSHIQDLVEMIHGRRYNPHINVPPVGILQPNGKIRLISGYHRKSAHQIVKKREMYTAIVEFFDYNGKPASYWQNNAYILLNNPPKTYVHNPATPEDFANAILREIDLGVFMTMDGDTATRNDFDNIFEDDILESIYQKGVPKHAKKLLFDILNHIRRRVNSISVVDTYTDTEIKDFINVYLESDRKPNEVFYPRSFKGVNDADYDKRLLFPMMEQFIKNPNTEFTIVGHTLKCDDMKTLLIRRDKLAALNQLFNVVREFVRIEQEIGHPIKFQIKWAPQLDGEKTDMMCHGIFPK